MRPLLLMGATAMALSACATVAPSPPPPEAAVGAPAGLVQLAEEGGVRAPGHPPLDHQVCGAEQVDQGTDLGRVS